MYISPANGVIQFGLARGLNCVIAIYLTLTTGDSVRQRAIIVLVDNYRVAVDI